MASHAPIWSYPSRSAHKCIERLMTMLKWDAFWRQKLTSSLDSVRLRTLLNVAAGDVLGKIIVLFMCLVSFLVRPFSFGWLRYYTKRWDPRFHSQQWIFKSRGLHQDRHLQCKHKVSVKHQLCKNISITVDDQENSAIVWEQSLWDVLDFGGKFRFTVTSPDCIENYGDQEPIVHDCLIVIHPWFMSLYVDGVNVVSGKTYVPSTFRLLIRLITLAACFFIFSFPFRSSPGSPASSSLRA
jgi:hypothetical protein